MADWSELVSDATDGGLIEWEVKRAIIDSTWFLDWPEEDAITDKADAVFDFSQITESTVALWKGDVKVVSLSFVGRSNGTFRISAAPSVTSTVDYPPPERWSCRVKTPSGSWFLLASGPFRAKKEWQA